MESIRTTIVGGSPLLQAGLVAALEQDSRIKLVGRLLGGQEAVLYARQHNCDVLVLIAEIPHLEAVPILQEIADTAAATKVLIFTANESCTEIIDSFRIGIHGYGNHTTLLPEDICTAIVSLVRGDVWLCPQTARRLLDIAVRLASAGPPRGGADALLSQRESEVLSLAATGAREDDIANSLCLSRNTVKTYLRRIREKLQADTRADAVNLAVERGLLLDRWPEALPHAVLANERSYCQSPALRVSPDR